MASLKATVDFREFNRVLAQYATNSKMTVEEAVAKKFNSVLIEVRKFQLATRPNTIAEIKAQAPRGLRFSRRTLQRMGKNVEKQRKSLTNAYKASKGKGKRAETAVLRIMKASAELQRLQENWQQIGWDMEKKQRENAAGRAGAWGWRTRGRTFNDIASNDKSARLQKVSTILKSYIELTNKRPDSAEFAERKGIITRAIAGVITDMKNYLETKLSKLP